MRSSGRRVSPVRWFVDLPFFGAPDGAGLSVTVFFGAAEGRVFFREIGRADLVVMPTSLRMAAAASSPTIISRGNLGGNFFSFFPPGVPTNVPPRVQIVTMKPTPKPRFTPKPVTEIAYILDRSGSMAPVTEAAIAGFNHFLRDQQQGELVGEGIARLTLVLFDDQYLVPIDNLPVSEVVALDSTTYVPRGSTALLDAVGTTIDAFKSRIRALPKENQPAKVVFAIFTDGEENASVKYRWTDIAGKIRRRREKDGWEFLFLAANQDAIATAAQMNIHAHDSATAQYSNQGIASSSRAFSRKIRSMREMECRVREEGAGSIRASGMQAPADLSKSMEELLREEEDRDDAA